MLTTHRIRPLTRAALLALAVPLALPAIASAAPWIPSSFIDDVADNSRDVELVDLDGDGWVDIVFANVGGDDEGSMDSVLPNQAYRNNEAISFDNVSDAVFGPGATDTARAIKSCDLDNDGDQDLIVGTTWETQSKLLINDGSGTFSDASGQLPQISASVGDVECGDVDGDDDLDLVLNDWGVAPVGQINSPGAVTMLWLNDGNASFSDATAGQMPDIAVNFSLDVDFVDVDNDYDLDLTVSCRACLTGSLLFINDGLGNFSAETPTTFTDLGARAYEAMDLNGDDFLDLVTLGDGDGGLDGTRNRILVNDGNGDFIDDTVSFWPLLENPGSGDRDAVFLDHDSDGDLDIALATNNTVAWPDRLMINNNGSYVQNTSPFGGEDTEGTQRVETADLNGDFHPDIVVASGENAYVNKIFWGDASETAVDVTPPSITNLENPGMVVYPATLTIRARVHDYKTPNKPHDWQEVFLEWAPGMVDANELEQNGTKEDALWYGEHLWRAGFEVPNNPYATYRLCAIDIAGNMACSEVVHISVDNVCGDGECGEDENALICPEDCDPVCGNGVVEPPEDCDDPNDPTCVGCMFDDSTTEETITTDPTTVTDSTSDTSNMTEGTTVGGPCFDDSDCPAGEMCVNGECVPEDNTDSDSLSGTGLDDDGCDCRADDSRGALPAFALLLLASLGRRRRRR